MAQSAIATYYVADSKDEKWGEDEAREWLYARGEKSPDRTFNVTMRTLAARWSWTVYRVGKLLSGMEAAGEIRRQVLPENGGTLVTVLRSGSIGSNGDEGAGAPPAILPLPGSKRGDEAITLDRLEELEVRPSAGLQQKLALAYQGIIYGEAGWEEGEVRHLELIEQALFPSLCPSLQLQEAA